MPSLPKIAKKIIVSFLLGVYLLLFLFPSNALAQSKTDTWYNPTYANWVKKVDAKGTDIFGERYTYAQVVWIFYSLIHFILDNAVGKDLSGCMNSGTDPTSLAKCVTDASKNYQTSSETTNDGNLVAAIFAPRPISAVNYFRDFSKKVSIVPVANAQTTGFGFNALDPILSLWKSTRNITYTLFIVIIIVMAFMIMFKVKLNPQTVITVQSAIPKVVIGLILVTFSYAIAGLMIDIMYVFIGLISILLIQSGQFQGVTLPVVGNVGQASNVVSMFNTLTQGPEVSAFGLTKHLGIFGFLVKYWLGVFVSGFMIFVSANSSLVTLAGGTIATLGFVIMIIVLLVVGVKVVWMLLKALAMVFLQTIFAPLQIALGLVVPGLGFGNWLKEYIANLAVFPVTGLLFVLASLFQSLSIGYAFKGAMDLGSLVKLSLIWAPGFSDLINSVLGQTPSGSWPPLLSLDDPNTTMALVFLGASFVVVTIIPKTVELIQSIIKGQAFNMQSAIGDATNPLGIRSLIQNTGQQYASNVIYNPKDPQSSLIPQIISRIRTGGGKASPGTGGAGGGPTP